MKKRITAMIMSLIMIISCIMVTAVPAAAETYMTPENAVTVSAPEKNIKLSFWLDESGAPYYNVSFNGEYLIENSKLGLKLSNGDIVSGLELTDTIKSSGNETWNPIGGEKEEILDRYNASAFVLTDPEGKTITVEARVYDTGAAFRYLLPSGSYTVNGEYTQYRIPAGTEADVHLGGNQTIPRHYAIENLNNTYRSPMTLSYASGAVMTICEANIDNFPPLRLKTESSCVLNAVYGSGSSTASVTESDPSSTPWRTFVIAESLARLPENTDIILNLNEAPESDFSWVKAGKNIMCTGNNTTESMKSWINCAKEQNYQYVLIDTGWYGPEWDYRCDPRLDPSALNDGSEVSELLKQYIIGDGHFKHPGFPMYGKLEESGTMVVDLDIPKVCEYAKEQGVGIILYVEDRALFDTLGRFSVDELFERFESWGVSGVKPGFVQYQTQEHQRRLEDMIASAAEHHLVMTIHDEYVPTGIERTYPNCLTTEGILGDEGIRGDQIAEDISVLFTRLIQGPSDHTFCYPGKGTKGYALASPILFRSGIQSLFWYGSPGSVSSCNQDEIKFWRDMPGEWDELKVLEAEMYSHATYARRSGTDWYIGSISAVDRNLRIPLDFLDENVKYVAEIYADPFGIDGTISGGISDTTGSYKAKEEMELGTFIVSSENTLKWNMAYGTGYAVRLRQASPEEIETIGSYDKYPLTKRIVWAETYQEKLYTPSTWQALEEAISDAKALLETESPTVEQLDRADDRIVAAIDGLRSIEALVNAIEMTDVLSANHYTDESWSVLRTAVDNARPLLTDSEVTQEQIDNAVQEITRAYNNLHKKDLEPDTITYLSSLKYEDNSTTAWGNIGINRSYENPQIQLVRNGEIQTFEYGIGVHASSNVYYNISGMGFEIFEAYVGVDAIKPIQGNVIFRIYGDDRLLYESKASGTGSNEAQFISIPVANIDILRLEADSNGSDNGDHADWADAKLLTMKELDPSSTISGIQVNGVELSEFAPAKTDYSLPVPADESVPEVTVSIPSDAVKYEIKTPAKVPGTVTVTVTRPDSVQMVYSLNFLNYDVSYASDITPSKTDKLGSDNGTWHKDIAQDNNPMSVTAADGSEMNFKKGIGMHASFAATYDISGKGYGRFQSWVGASHMKEYKNSMTFLVYLNENDTPVFDSGVMSYRQPAKFVDIDLSGASSITLVLDMGEADFGDHGNWADAKFLTYRSMPNKEIVSVTNPSDKTVPYGTAFSELRLPSKLAVSLDDGSDTELDVTWNSADYDGNTAGNYRINGTLSLPNDVSNSSGIEIFVLVTVKDPVVPGITSISIDGYSLDEFDADRYEYSYPVISGNDIPVVGVTTASDEVKAEITQASSADGKAVIDVTRADSSKVSYTVDFKRAVGTYLSDLEWVSKDAMGTPYGNVIRDSGVEGLPMTVTASDGSEMRFEKGLGMQANCTVVYDIEGKGYSRLEGWLGASHSKVYNNNMIFEIYADNESEPRYRSAEKKYLTPADYVNLDLEGVKTLKLVLDKNGPDSGDHGNWADIKFITYKDLSQFSVVADESAYKNEPFNIILTTSSSVEKLSLKNENGKLISILSAEKELNQHNGYTWRLTAKLGTAGENRVIGVYNGNDMLGSFSVDIKNHPTGIYEIANPNSALTWEKFNVTVKTTRDLIKGKFTSENGAVIGSSIVQRTYDGDYMYTTYTLSIGTKGERSIRFIADKNLSNEYPYSSAFTISISEPETVEIVSLDTPEAATANGKFNVTVVCSGPAKSVSFTNEIGGKLGKTLISSKRNNDGTITFVYSIAINSVGERTIDVTPSDGVNNYNSSSFDIIIVK